MRKKVLSYLLCGAMALSMTACGEKPAESSQPESVEESSEEPAGDEQESSEEEPPAEESSEEESSAEEETPVEEEPEEAAAGPMVLKTEAEAFVDGDVTAEGDHLGGLKDKAWAMYNVDLADGGYKQIGIRYGADSIGGTVRLWIGDADYEEFGEMIGEATFEGTGSWDMNSMVVFDVPNLGGQSGATDLVIEWESPEGESDYLMNPDYFELYKTTSAGAKTNTWNFFDNDFSANEVAGFRGEEPDYTHIYVTTDCYTGYKLDFGEEGGFKELALTGDFVGECALELHLDSPDGELVGNVAFTGAADWTNVMTNTYTVEVPELESVTGGHGIYFVFKSGDFNFASFRFYNKPALKLSERVEAELDIEGTTSHDVSDVSSAGGNIGGTQGNVYIIYRLDFEDGGYNKVLMRFGTITPGGTIDVHYGDPNGELITTIAINRDDAPDSKPENFGSDWAAFADFEIDVPDLAGLTGEQIICFVFHPTDGDDNWVGNFDYYEFSK
jgi:hypothetical protein